MFLVLVSFLLTTAAGAAVEPPLRVSSLEEPRGPRRLSSIFSDFPSRHTERDGSCPISGMDWCGSELPEDFCCPSESSCKVLAANTTALCCPKGSTCINIQPIICKITFQDPSAYPAAPIKTLALDQKLKRCGSNTCCPLGYSCEDGTTCVLDKDQEEAYAFLIPGSLSATTETATATHILSTSADAVLPVETLDVPDAAITTLPPSASASTTESASPDTQEGDEEEENGHGGVSPTGVVTAGTVAGVCCLAGIGIFVWMKWFRKRRTPDTPLMTQTRDTWGYFSSHGGTSRSTQYLRVTRGPDDKFIVTPSTAGFPPPLPLPQIVEEAQQSPVELPATPVSLCMWSNLEYAAVEEPKLAYVVPAKQHTGQ
ncbi:hypothetical protein FZEAL_1353 [Fusarium zealandicum]|uniref:Uncharacterized protein n=1 Tax=Fusarium zealandicum TaxID=1053134 RepID=A0A8H4USY2_9HYPO|nr:hypothetical protein FZEAL_1353 [Fusarium zealandicum]